MTPSWSVVMATHNGERFVAEQLHSILDQTTPPAEVLVGDDDSTDATRELIESISATHPRGGVVRILRRRSALGVVGNFHDLVARAAGDLIALSDQDDRWRPDRLELLAAPFRDRPGLLLIHHDATLVDEHGQPLGALFDSLRVSPAALDDEHAGRGFERMLKRNLVTGAASAMRAELREHAGSVPTGWMHDEWFGIVAAALDGIDVDRRRLIDYRQHGGNQIGAEKLDLRTAASRFAAAGSERNRRLLARADSLASRLATMEGVRRERRALATAKARHEAIRSGLSTSRMRRMVPVISESLAGGYRQFGNGVPDVVRDLVQPLGDG